MVMVEREKTGNRKCSKKKGREVREEEEDSYQRKNSERGEL